MIKSKAAVLHEMGLSRPYGKSNPLKIEAVELNDPGFNEVFGGPRIVDPGISAVKGFM